ncbi:A/G-specific adenine glycosylase [Zhouia sp. PK063]|uniref:A/G-specific adenine glycosylase n=1 Tax=Zhouia sp. PK063 TaxID=3373602 RepID=UPI003795226F
MSFSKVILQWYAQNKRDLPWRKTKNPYHIWLSEIMLQQTRVEQGMPYYQAFIEAYPTVFDLANAHEDEVLKLWQGLGYYSRARNLHSTAKKVAFELAGNFPNNFNELLKLKGIGDYTASAIASFCFNEAAPVVDGNVYRVLSRYFGVAIAINSTEGIKYFKNLAQELIPIKEPGTYNQAIMEFGAIQCKPKNPSCNNCPLNNSCIALRDGLVEKLPVKLKKLKVKQRYFNYLIIIDVNNTTILEQRTGKGIWQNLFEFPLVETQTEATAKDIMTSEKFKLIVGIDAFELQLYNQTNTVHKLSHQHLHTKFWIVTLNKPLKEGIPASEIKNYAVPVLIANFVNEFNF